MTESKYKMAPGFEELYCIFNEQEDSTQELKDEIIKIIKTPITSEKNSLIDKKRALKRWKQSFGYHSLNPEKFKFSLRDL